MATKFEFYYSTNDTTTNAYGAIWTAQTFTTTSSHTITSFKENLSREGSPGTITGHLRATTSNLPSGSDLTTGTTDGNALAVYPSYTLAEIVLAVETTLSNATKYAFIHSIAGDANNQIHPQLSTTNPYTGGDWCSSGDSGSTWTEHSTNCTYFEVWGNPLGGKNAAPSLTLLGVQ